MTQEMYNILAADQYVDPIAEPDNLELLQAKNPAVDPFTANYRRSKLKHRILLYLSLN